MGGKDEDGVEEGASGSSVDGFWEREEREKVRGVGSGVGDWRDGREKGGAEGTDGRREEGERGGREAGRGRMGGGMEVTSEGTGKERERNVGG